MKAVLIQTSQDTMHMQYMGNVPWMLPRSTRLPEQLFCHPYGLMAVWYILRTKVEQLHSDFVNIYLADDVYYSAYSARTAHPFQRNGAPFRFKLSKAQQVD